MTMAQLASGQVAWGQDVQALYVGGTAEVLLNSTVTGQALSVGGTFAGIGNVTNTPLASPSADFDTAFIPAADVIATLLAGNGSSKVQLRAVAGVFCGTAPTGATTPQIGFGRRMRVDSTATAVPPTTWTQFGSYITIGTTINQFTWVDTGWVDSSITLNGIYDFAVSFKAAAITTGGNYSARLAILMRGA